MLALRHLLDATLSTFMIWILWALALCLAPISRSARYVNQTAIVGIYHGVFHSCATQLTALSDGIGYSDISVLSVHVVCTRTRVISQPNTKVLNNSWLLFINLREIKRTLNTKIFWMWYIWTYSVAITGHPVLTDLIFSHPTLLLYEFQKLSQITFIEIKTIHCMWRWLYHEISLLPSGRRYRQGCSKIVVTWVLQM